ncbi:MAG: hypothetical protein AAFN18_12020 [Cyanobacteria bacterium J06554_6]
MLIVNAQPQQRPLIDRAVRCIKELYCRFGYTVEVYPWTGLGVNLLAYRGSGRIAIDVRPASALKLNGPNNLERMAAECDRTGAESVVVVLGHGRHAVKRAVRQCYRALAGC